MPTIAGIVTLTLKAGAHPAAFDAGARATGPLVQAQAGFVRRQFSQGPDGRRTDYVLWRGMEAAQAAGRVILQDSTLSALAAMIDESAMQARHKEILWSAD